LGASSLTAGKNYLLTLRGTYKTPSGTFGFALNRFLSFGSTGPFAQPPNPLTVTPTLDTAHSVGQTISAANGGTVAATGADGSVFTLAIPANALLSDELITMTPLSAVGNLPVRGGLLAGVQLSPDGLLFQQPATLTIQPAVSVPVGQQVGFGYHANGTEFYFQPLGLTSTITISLTHFSGAGVGQGTAGNGGNPTSPADQLSQQVAQILNQERQCQLTGIDCDPFYPQDLIDLFQEYYTEVVAPLMQQALTDDSVAQAAIQAIADWARMVQLLFPQTELLASEAQNALAQIPLILQNAYNKAFGRCVNDASQDQRMVEALKMVSTERNLELLGRPNPNFNTQIAACLTGPLTLGIDSNTTLDEVGPLSELFTSHVTAPPINMTFDTASLAYKGTGPLNYDSHTFSVVWPAGAGSDCSSGVGTSGTVDVTAQFDLNVNPLQASNVNQFRMNIGFSPNVSETETECLIPPIGPPASFTLPPNNPSAYAASLGGAHAGLTPPGSTVAVSPYFMSVNTAETFDFMGSGSSGGVAVTATEASTLTLEQTSP
jgi:hypothetical protein